MEIKKCPIDGSIMIIIIGKDTVSYKCPTCSYRLSMPAKHNEVKKQ